MNNRVVINGDVFLLKKYYDFFKSRKCTIYKTNDRTRVLIYNRDKMIGGMVGWVYTGDENSMEKMCDKAIKHSTFQKIYAIIRDKLIKEISNGHVI